MSYRIETWYAANSLRDPSLKIAVAGVCVTLGAAGAMLVQFAIVMGAI